MNSFQRIKASLKIFINRKTTIVFLTLVVLFLALAPAVFAQTLDVGLQYGEYTGLSSQDIRISIMKIVRAALGFLGVLVIVIILYGGFIWMTSGGNPEKIDKAKKILTNALIGLIIILSAFSIVWFIISMLEGALRGPGGPSWREGDDGCENCNILGNGVLESVYPYPLQEDVPRNTSIIVTFKVEMDPSTIIDDTNASGVYGDCTGTAPDVVCDTIATTDDEPNIKIHPYNQQAGDLGQSNYIAADEVIAIKSNDSRTFTFKPNDYLDADTWYRVRLEGQIKQPNGEAAFGSLGRYFAWRFLVGNYLDLDPPEISTVFPQPDNEPDTYDETEAVQAKYTLTVNSLPQHYIPAGHDAALTDAGSSTSGNVVGNYDCDIQADVCLNVGAGGNISLTVNQAGTGCDGPPYQGAVSFPGSVPNGTIVDISCGLQVEFADLPVSGDTWYFSVQNEVDSDILTVDSKTYTFVESSPGPNEIEKGTDVDNQALKIKLKLYNDSGQLRLELDDLEETGPIITLAAKEAGSSGNGIPLSAPGSWADAQQTVAGVNPGGGQTRNDILDKPRNAIITFTFNEALRPDRINSNNIIVRYQKSAGVWEVVPGELLLSNMYRTIDFIPESKCGVCSETASANADQPCGSDADCGGDAGACENVKNSCGEEIYCLPVVPGECVNGDDAGDTCFSNLDCAGVDAYCDYQPTRYKVNIVSAKVQTCTDSANCVEQDFGECERINPFPADLAGRIVGTTPNWTDDMACAFNDPGAIGPFWPQTSEATSGGLIDAANNVMNGNKTTLTLSSGKVRGAIEGSVRQNYGYTFSLNEEREGRTGYCRGGIEERGVGEEQRIRCTLGPNSQECIDAGFTNTECILLTDDLVWDFYINKNLDLSPSNVIEIKPNVNSTDVSLKSSIDALFDELIMGSTLKPGFNYRDGLCSCGGAGGSCPGSQECIDDRCKNTQGDQSYCLQNSDCNPGSTCHNKKYVSLIDNRNQIGWWITQQGIEIRNDDGLYDNYADQTLANINHTKFSENTKYSSELGAGIKDVYQNCYKPSRGPGAQGFCVHPCSSSEDCPTGETCDMKTRRCSGSLIDTCVTGGTCCTSDADCGANEYCYGYYDPETEENACSGMTIDNPYCCNGAAMNQATWEESACFTGY